MTTMQAITAARTIGQPCHGCLYQVESGTRKPKNVAPSEYACDNCGVALCRPHIQYEERGDWWLCAKCLVIYERKRGLR